MTITLTWDEYTDLTTTPQAIIGAHIIMVDIDKYLANNVKISVVNKDGQIQRLVKKEGKFILENEHI